MTSEAQAVLQAYNRLRSTDQWAVHEAIARELAPAKHGQHLEVGLAARAEVDADVH